MIKKFAFLILLNFSSSNLIAGGFDFCNIIDVVPDDGLNIKLPYRNESERYQVSYEQIIDTDQLYDTEVVEYYDGLKNVGVANLKFLNYDYHYYAYFDRNEFLQVTRNVCVVSELSEHLQDIIFTVIDVDGKPHIASPLTLLSNNLIQNVAYLGSKDRYVRGIPVRQWLACINHKSFVTRVILSYSNPDKWTPALLAPGYESVPVHIEVSTLNQDDPELAPRNEVYNLFDFRPGLNIREDFYSVPPGIFCSGRFNLKSFPKLPKSFSFLVNLAENYDSQHVQLSTFKYEYFLDKNLIRNNYIVSERGFSRLIDLNTDLDYMIYDKLGVCLVSQSSTSEPLDLFRVDEETPYEYIGQRRVRGINTDVWSAPRNFSNELVLYEWYFTTDGWSSLAYYQPEPVLLIIYEPQIKERVTWHERLVYEISDFKPHVNIYDFDLSVCNDLERKHMRFSISGQINFDLITKNQASFKEGVLYALEKYSGVGIIRISQIEVIYDKTAVFVLFTLMDKSSTSNALTELTLEESYIRLMSNVNKKEFSIVFKDSNNNDIIIEPDWNSFIVLDQRHGKYVYNSKNVLTSGLNIGVVIGLIVGGLLAGFVLSLLGTLVYYAIKRNRDDANETMMSMSNPIS